MMILVLWYRYHRSFLNENNRIDIHISKISSIADAITCQKSRIKLEYLLIKNSKTQFKTISGGFK